MELIVTATASEAAQLVAASIIGQIQLKPSSVLGLAAGRTPRAAYRLIAEHRPLAIPAAVVMLDEYLGLGPTDPGCFRRDIRSTLTDPLGLEPERLHTLDGLTDQPALECQRFEDTIAALGGIDLQLLGLGRNGHIAFNEPGSAHDSRTRVVALSEATRADNASAFSASRYIPRHALTQGIGTILDARTIILLATGSPKAVAVRATVEGQVTTEVPASALQHHDDVMVVVDHDAAQQLLTPALSH